MNRRSSKAAQSGTCIILRSLFPAPKEEANGAAVLTIPSGGKTELTLAFTDYLFGEGKLWRLDMSGSRMQESLGVLLRRSKSEEGTLGVAVKRAGFGTTSSVETRRRTRASSTSLWLIRTAIAPPSAAGSVAGNLRWLQDP